MADQLGLKDGLELYETGKHRRYALWFAVNGGAFAVTRLLMDAADNPGLVLGGLSLRALAIGMTLFTAVMAADIFAFGLRMASALQHHKTDPEKPVVFGLPGRVVLTVLTLLIIIGWLLVGFAPPAWQSLRPTHDRDLLISSFSMAADRQPLSVSSRI